jgi:hypothetical protein
VTRAQNNRRDALTTLRNSLHPETTISELQWLQLVGILDQIIEGYDVRESHGIPAKAGKRPTKVGMHKWMALHFAALRAVEPDVALKEHLGVVAQAWGVKDNYIRKIVDKYCDSTAVLMREMTPTQSLSPCRSSKPNTGSCPKTPPS